MTDTEIGTRKSSGVAKAGLALGIVGTALGAMSGAGILGNGIFGCGCGTNKTVSELESKVAELKAMRYTDGVSIDLYKNIIAKSNEEDNKISALQTQTFAYIYDLDKRTALAEQAAVLNRQYDTMAREYQMTIMNNKVDAAIANINNKIDCCCEKNNMIVCFNKQLSELADASILSYVNSNFLPGQLKLPSSSITPPVQLA